MSAHAFETLEGRRLLAHTATMVDNILTITGSSRSDKLTATYVIRLTKKGALDKIVLEVRDASYSQMKVYDAAGPDGFRYDLGRGDDRLALGIQIYQNGKYRDWTSQEIRSAREVHNPYPDTVDGGAGRDTIIGSWAGESLIGAAGADSIVGNDGDDTISGGSSGDTLWGGRGDDSISGDADDDVLYGEFGNDTLYGGDGRDALWAGPDGDQLFGGGGNDSLYGESGNDGLYGGDGDDLCSGGSGDDFLDGERGHDTLSGGNNYDTYHEEGYSTDILDSVERRR